MELLSELKEKNLELEVKYQENRKLATMLCHDINNPLSVIMLANSSLRKCVSNLPGESDLKKGKTLIDKSSRAVMIISEITSEARNFLSTERDFRVSEVHKADVGEILDFLQFLFAEKFAEKKIKLTINNKIPKSTKIKAKEVDLKSHILSNILSNALKFTPTHGQVTLTIYSKRDEICFEIIDTGAGIPKQKIQSLFENKTIDSSNGTEGEVGTGFGLSIVKGYVERNGGRLEVISKEKNDPKGPTGTAFSVFLKVA